MNLLIVLPNGNMGGAERQAFNLAVSLRERGVCNINFLLLNSNGGLFLKLLIENNFNVLFFDYETFYITKRWEIVSPIVSLYYTYLAINQIIKFGLFLRKTNSQIILPFTYYANVTAGLSCKFSRASKCFWNQRDIGTQGMNNSVWEKIASILVSGYVSNSYAGLELLEKKFKIKNKKKEVIYNGVSLPNDKQNISRINTCFTFIMIANFHSDKDHETVIYSFSKLIESYGANYRLILMGRKSGNENAIQDLVKNKKIEKFVIFVFDSIDTQYYLSTADVVLHSSNTEGLPNSVLEAMYSSKPVIATNVSGCIEALGQEYEYFFEVGNQRKLTEYMFLFSIDKALSNSVGKQLKARAEKHFSIDRMTDSYIKLFNF